MRDERSTELSRFAQEVDALLEARLPARVGVLLTTHNRSQDVVAGVTMPKFRCKVSDRRTAIHHAHEGALTSTGWLPAAFGET